MILVLVIVILLVIFIYLNLNILTVSKYEIKDKKIPNKFDGYKIVHLTDLHAKEFGKGNKTLIKKIIKLDPDCIVMTGDMVYRKSEDYSSVISLCEILTKKYNVYYSLGNHEVSFHYSLFKEFLKALKENGVTVLHDKQVEIINKNQCMCITGLTFKSNMEFNKTDKKAFDKHVDIVRSSLKEWNTNHYNILLAHDPLNYELYDKLGANLVFSGHVHGGAIRIFGRGLFSPRMKLFPKYTDGVYQGKSGQMVVGRGLGNGNFRIRICNFPEIVSVTLKNNG